MRVLYADACCFALGCGARPASQCTRLRPSSPIAFQVEADDAIIDEDSRSEDADWVIVTMAPRMRLKLKVGM